MVRGCGFQRGDHVCWTYGSEHEHCRVLSDYFCDGASAGEKLVYVAPDRQQARLLEYLSNAGERPHILIRRGQLVLADVDGAHVRDGRFNPTERLRQYEADVGQALEEGFSGLRVAGEAASVVRHPAVNGAWAGFELRADLMAARLPFVGLCGYDLRDCDGIDLEVVKAVHTREIHDGSSEAPMFRLHATPGGALTLEGEVDLTCASTVAELLRSTQADIDELRVDVSRLAFIDVAGMRELALTAAAASGRAVSRICGASPMFRKMWALLELDKLDGVQLNGCEAAA